MSAYISMHVQSNHDDGINFLTYDISMDGDNKLWITNNDGEGGQFDAEKFFNAVDKFFKDNY